MFTKAVRKFGVTVQPVISSLATPVRLAETPSGDLTKPAFCFMIRYQAPGSAGGVLRV